MATHSSIPAWRIPGMGEPGGLPSMGSHRVRHNGVDLAAAAACQEHRFGYKALSSLLASYSAPVSGAPNWASWGSRHYYRKSCLSLSRNSNSPNWGWDYLNDPQKYAEDFTGLILLYVLTWKDVIYVLGWTLISEPRAQVLGKATAFGDDWFERETSGNREHEIALLPTGSKAVPITEPDWDYNMVKGR